MIMIKINHLAMTERSLITNCRNFYSQYLMANRNKQKESCPPATLGIMGDQSRRPS